MTDWRDTLPAVRGKLVRDADLAPFTWFRVGGKADVLFLPADHSDLADFLRGLPAEVPVTVLGVGSNVIVRDGGVEGVVIRLMGKAFAYIGLDEDGNIVADAGVLDSMVAKFAAKSGIAGLEFYAGIPGTIGGALTMNAGCYGGETWNHVVRVEVLTRDGRFEVRVPSDYAFGYRSVRRADGSPPDGIFTAVWMSFPPGDATKARARIKELLSKRIASQPLSLPNAGSVFRNPEGDHAARLIEAAGLKGHTIGGARVSEMHANFIVNPGARARASDIEALIAHVRATVEARFGVELEPEVRIVGLAANGDPR